MRVLLMTLVLLGSPEDTVHRTEGEPIVGVARVAEELVRVTTMDGTQVDIPHDQVTTISWSRTSKEPKRLRKELRTLAKELDEVALARWCTRFGLDNDASKYWKKVQKRHPYHVEAYQFLRRIPMKVKPAQIVLAGPDPWDEIEEGLTLKTAHFVVRGDLGAERLMQLAEVAERMNLFHTEHFGADIGDGWKITFFRKKTDFVAYSRKIGSSQYGGAGYTEAGREEFVGHGEAGQTFETLVKHELGHAYYHCPGPFWMREGSATLVESLEWVKGQPVIEVNRVRLQQLKSYWAQGKHKDLRCCTLKPVFPLAYAHHWSFHYYVWKTKGKEFYRAMLKELQNTREKDDLTQRVVEMLEMESLESLEASWKSFVEGIQ